MQCRDCRRLEKSDGCVGKCTAREINRYTFADVMGCPYFEEREKIEVHPDSKRLMELLYVVQQKVPGESRFDTALRMLKERQEQTSRGCDAKAVEGDNG